MVYDQSTVKWMRQCVETIQEEPKLKYGGGLGTDYKE